MARYFALPVMATVLALVGVRMIAAGEPADRPMEIVVSRPVQEPERPLPVPEPMPQEKPAPEPPPPPAPAPKPEPMIIILEPIPAPAPAPQPEPTPPVVVTQTTIVQNTTNNYFPVATPVVVAPEPEPKREVIETPVMVVVCAAHGRPGCCIAPPRRAAHRQQDTFFKQIPFLPPTPRGPRYTP
jgi:hypothetical protein